MLHIDIETAGEEDLTKVGVYRYAQSARILLFAWAFDVEPVQLVDLAAGEALPPAVIDALRDPSVAKVAHNANFERTLISTVLGIPCPPAQWRCTAVLARSLGLPGDLAGAGEALGLASDKAKLATGKRLITTFCKPRKPTPKKPWVWTTAEHEPAKWEQFKEYCIRDVEAEREIHARLVDFDMPETEWKLWALDQEINDRGVLVSDALVSGAMAIDTALRDTLLEEAGTLTSLDNPNSREQLLQWLRDQDVELEDLTRDTVAKAVEHGVGCEKATRVLEIRQQLAKASIKKYLAVSRAVSADNRVRGLLQFNGAGRTGRWAGRIMQPQNLPRPVGWLHSDDDEETDARYAAAIEIVSLGDYDLARSLYGSDVPDLLASLIRCTLTASLGSRLVISDFSAIEARVLAWLAGEKWRMGVFNTHGKIYEASASEMFKVPLERIKKGNPEYALRQKGKVAELACLGPETLVLTDRGYAPIIHITSNDKVWDGKSWVKHKGVAYQGYKKTIFLAGVTITPDHKILTGETWSEAEQLSLNASILYRALEIGSRNLPSSAMSDERLGLATTTSLKSRAPAGLLTTMYNFQTLLAGRARDAMSALKRKRVIGARRITSTPRFALMTSTGDVCSTESRRLSQDATLRMHASIRTTVEEGSRFTLAGEKTKELFSRTLSRLLGGTCRVLKSTGLMLIAAMSRETCASSQRPITPETREASEKWKQRSHVFDLLCCGPNNRFTILSEQGPLIVHNCGYQGGPSALVAMGALEMGLKEAELPEIITAWRKANPAVTRFWYEVQAAFIAATETPGKVHKVGHVKFKNDDDWTFIRLPSGRKLAYYKPEINNGIWFMGVNGLTKKFEKCQTFGGRLVENITQAVARDCLAEALLALNDAGYRTVLHVHDEVVAEMPLGQGSLEEMNAIMGRELPWAPGLPLKGAGFETTYYRKD